MEKESIQIGREIGELVNPLVKIELPVDVMKYFSCADSVPSRKHCLAIERETVDSFHGLRANEERIQTILNSILGIPLARGD